MCFLVLGAPRTDEVSKVPAAIFDLLVLAHSRRRERKRRLESGGDANSETFRWAGGNRTAARAPARERWRYSLADENQREQVGETEEELEQRQEEERDVEQVGGTGKARTKKPSTGVGGNEKPSGK
jgi:hypothetical protein